jgi:hypothetical protein
MLNSKPITPFQKLRIHPKVYKDLFNKGTLTQEIINHLKQKNKTDRDITINYVTITSVTKIFIYIRIHITLPN